MKLEFERKRMAVVSARGMTDAVCTYEFAFMSDDGTKYALDAPTVVLTTGLDVAFLCARQFTDESVLVLYHTGNPVDPQFVVAEFHFDNRTISHLQDHGDDWSTAHADFEARQPGEMTAIHPEDQPTQADV